MQVPADARRITHDGQHVGAEVARVARDEAQPQEAGHFLMDAAQQIGEGGGARRGRGAVAESLEARANLRSFATAHRDRRSVRVAVVIDGLAQKRDFHGSRLHQALALVHDVVRRPMHFRTTRVGHHAIRAELVATARDAHVGAPRLLARAGVEGAREVEHLQPVLRCAQRGGAARTVAGKRHATHALRLLRTAHVVDELRQLVQLRRPAEDVHLRMAAQHVDAVALCHAAEHSKDESLAPALAHADHSHAAQRLLLRELAHRARVVENHLRIGVVIHHLVAQGDQLPPHQLAVELVHLAAECLEIDAHGGLSVVDGHYGEDFRPPRWAGKKGSESAETVISSLSAPIQGRIHGTD